jgi:hypothetical protein
MTQKNPSPAPSGRMTLSPSIPPPKFPPVSEQAVIAYCKSYGMDTHGPICFYPRKW